MIQKIVARFKEELGTFTRSEVIFILCAMVCGFCICADYALVRPVSNAVFITRYGSSFFAQVWLATVPFTFVCIALYNRLLPKVSCVKLLLGLIGAIALIDFAALFLLKSSSWFPFFFYLWKEVYVMLLFQQLWAVIHATVSLKRAQLLYGLFFAVGALGGIFGSLIPGFLALKVGSEPLLLLALPFLALLFVLYRKAVQHSGLIAHLPPTKQGGVGEGVRQIAASKILLFILLLVLLMQTTTTFLDFQFNHFLEGAFSTKDLRTAYTGRVMSLVNTLSFTMQIGGGLFLIAFFGVRRLHLLIPFVFLVNAILSLFFPFLGMVTFSFVVIKGLDFSLFHVIKEMLYVPLRTEEKFHAKSLIDVFIYRASKAFSALAILLFQRFLPIHLNSLITWTLIALFIFWIAASWIHLRTPQTAKS